MTRDVGRLPRSMLFAPAHEGKKVARLAGLAAECVCLDLEDTVPAAEKPGALAAAREFADGYGGAAEVAVRINARDSGRSVTDIVGIVSGQLDAIVAPKVEAAAGMAELDAMLRVLEDERGIETPIAVYALIETARGLGACEAIARDAPERVKALIFGLADFAADLGIPVTGGACELTYARSRVVAASRAGGMAGALDGPFLRLDDDAGLSASSVWSHEQGFRGRVVIHPSQLEPVHAAYGAATGAALARARRIVEEFESAERTGHASIRVDGEFVDYPIYAQARTVLAAAG